MGESRHAMGESRHVVAESRHVVAESRHVVAESRHVIGEAQHSAVEQTRAYPQTSLPFLHLKGNSDIERKVGTPETRSNLASSVPRPSVIQHTIQQSAPVSDVLYGSNKSVADYHSTQYYHQPSPQYYPHKKPRLEPHLAHQKYYSAPFSSSGGTIGSRAHANSTYVSYPADDDGVLDLSIKKPKKEEAAPKIETPAMQFIDVEQYERITPPDKELDLSVKKTIQCTIPIAPSHHHHKHYLDARNNLCADKSCCNDLSGHNMVRIPPPKALESERPVKPLGEPKTEKGSNSQCLTVSCTPIMAKQPYYSPHQLPTPYYASSMYPYSPPFLVQSSSPYMPPPEHLHASITAYKDLYCSSFYQSGPYSPYPPPPPLYHHLYKENNLYPTYPPPHK